MGLSIICPEGRVSKVWGHIPFLGSKNGHLGNHNLGLISRKFHQGFQKCLTEEYQLSSLNLEASVVAFLNLRFLGLDLVLKLSVTSQLLGSFLGVFALKTFFLERTDQQQGRE